MSKKRKRVVTRERLETFVKLLEQPPIEPSPSDEGLIQSWWRSLPRWRRHAMTTERKRTTRKPVAPVPPYDETLFRLFNVRVRLTPADERLIAKVMARFGCSRADAIERLWLNGGI